MEEPASKKIDFESIEETAKLSRDRNDDLIEDIEYAEFLMKSFPWVHSIKQTYVGAYFEGIVGIYLFEIIQKETSAPDFIWLFLGGDSPILWLPTDESPNPAEALITYLDVVGVWVDAVLNSKPTEDLAPIDVPETVVDALRLRRHLAFLEDYVLPQCSGR